MDNIEIPSEIPSEIPNKIANKIANQENCINIFIPFTIKKRGGNVATMILPHNQSLTLNLSKEIRSEDRHYDYPLINALVRAYRLQKKLDKDPRMTISQLAEQEGLTKGYVGRLLRLNLLAPDIVESILEGDQPRDLKLQDLLRKDVPIIWDEQKDKFGFNYPR